MSTAKVEKAKSEYQDAVKDLEAKKSAVSEAEANKESAKADLDKLNADVAEAEKIANERKADLDAANKELTEKTSELNAAKEDLAVKQNKAVEAQKALTEKQNALQKADAEVLAAKNNASDAKADAEKQSSVMKAVHDAEEAFAAAKQKIADLAKELTDRTNAIETLNEKLAEAQEALAKAQDKVERAKTLDYDDMFENPITDEDFAYLNTYIERVKVLRQKVAEEEANRGSENTSIQNDLDDIGEKYGITLTAVITDDVSAKADTTADAELTKTISGAQYGQWLQLTVGKKISLSADTVKAMMNSKNDIYFVFDYMGYRWTVKVQNRNTLKAMLNADGTLNLLKFISYDHMEDIVKIEPLQV